MKKSPSVRIREGINTGDIILSKPQALTIYESPIELSKTEQSIFKQIIELNEMFENMTDADLTLVAIAAKSWGQYIACQTNVTKCIDNDDSRSAKRWDSLATSAFNRYHALCKQLGIGSGNRQVLNNFQTTFAKKAESMEKGMIEDDDIFEVL